MDETAVKEDLSSSSDSQQVIVILDKASLEIVNTKSGDFTLLNCDDHVSLMYGVSSLQNITLYNLLW